VRSAGFSKGSGAVRRADGINDIRPIQRFFDLVSGKDHRLKSFKHALAADAPVVLDGLDTVRELLKIKQTDPMAVGRTVECNGTATVSRAQHSDVHILILTDSGLYISHAFGKT
jgi:hypothetical protein